MLRWGQLKEKLVSKNSVTIPQFQRSATFQGTSGEALKVELTSVTYTSWEQWSWLQSDLPGNRGVLTHNWKLLPHEQVPEILSYPETGRRLLWTFWPPFPYLRGGRAIKATRRRWMTYPCSLSGRAGVRLQGSPLPSLGLFSRRQTGSSRTPRALWLELVWIPGLQTVGHSSVCTWSFPTFKEENLPHDSSLPDPLII